MRIPAQLIAEFTEEARMPVVSHKLIAWCVGALEKVLHDAGPHRDADSVEADACRGEVTSARLAVRATKSLRDIRATGGQGQRDMRQASAGCHKLLPGSPVASHSAQGDRLGTGSAPGPARPATPAQEKLVILRTKLTGVGELTGRICTSQSLDAGRLILARA